MAERQIDPEKQIKAASYGPTG